MSRANAATLGAAATTAGVAAVLYGSLVVVPRAAAGQIALPVAFGAPLLLLGAAVLAASVALRPAAVEAAVGLAPGALAERRLRRCLVTGALVAAAAVAALLLASDLWAYTTLGWAVPRGAPIFVG